MTTSTLGWGAPGWLVLGAVFAVVGGLVAPVVRGALANRPAAAAPAAAISG